APPLRIYEIRVDSPGLVVGCEACRVLSCDLSIDEGAQHVVMRDSRRVSRGIKSRNRRSGVLVRPDARGTVAAAKADLRNVHLHHILSVVGAAPLMKPAASGPLVRVQYPFDMGDGLFRQVIELQDSG